MCLRKGIRGWYIRKKYCTTWFSANAGTHSITLFIVQPKHTPTTSNERSLLTDVQLKVRDRELLDQSRQGGQTAVSNHSTLDNLSMLNSTFIFYSLRVNITIVLLISIYAMILPLRPSIGWLVGLSNGLSVITS